MSTKLGVTDYIFQANFWSTPVCSPWITHAHHTTSCRHKHRAVGSLSESGARRRPAMTAGSFNQRLTGGGEAACLIDCRQRLSIQGCCCCLQHEALIWWRTLSVSTNPLSSSICPRFLLLLFHSPAFFHPVPLLLSSFHSANHSFRLPCDYSFFLPHQHIPLWGIWAKPLRQIDHDEWWGKPDLSPCLSFLFSFLLSFTWSWLCFLWCTIEANENAPLGGRWCAFGWLGPKATSLAIELQ